MSTEGVLRRLVQAILFSLIGFAVGGLLIGAEAGQTAEWRHLAMAVGGASGGLLALAMVYRVISGEVVFALFTAVFPCVFLAPGADLDPPWSACLAAPGFLVGWAVAQATRPVALRLPDWTTPSFPRKATSDPPSLRTPLWELLSVLVLESLVLLPSALVLFRQRAFADPFYSVIALLGALSLLVVGRLFWLRGLRLSPQHD